MKTKKMLIMIVVVISLLVVAVLGTYAYITYKLGPMTNVFTYGDIKLKFYEDSVSGGKTSDGNTYDLQWNKTYTKNVTLELENGSSPCYVFVIVENELVDVESTEISSTQDSDGYLPVKRQILDEYSWSEYPEVNSNYIDIYVKRFGGNITSSLLLKEFRTAERFNYNLINDLDNDGSAEITFTVYAIEDGGFSGYVEAWNILKSQFPELQKY